MRMNNLKKSKSKVAKKAKKSGLLRRPLSAYNIFFKIQRHVIISNKPGTIDAEQIDLMINELKMKAVVDPKKRPHRKTHGKIGFAELARKISARWNEITPEMKKPYVSLALKEKLIYYRKVNELENMDNLEHTLSSDKKEDSCQINQTILTPTTPPLVLSPIPSQVDLVTNFEPLPFTCNNASAIFDKGACDILRQFLRITKNRFFYLS
eukprot:348645_1